MGDRQGVGVAKLIISSRIQRPRDVVDPLSAIDQGEVPFITSDLWFVLQLTWRLVWERVAFRNLIKWCSSASHLFYFDVEEYPGVRGHVALTIDDAPCRLGPKNSKVPEVRTLLQKYDAQASFMLIGSFVPGNEDDLVSLLKDGHEFGNHGFVDKNYASCSQEEVEAAIDRCSRHITDLQQRAGLPQHVRWFRPPHGKLSAAMSEVLERKKLTSVMCDAYAWCAQIQDGEFIGNFLGTQVQHGSIIILHMPEHGFREWCFVGLEALLRILNDRGLRAVSLGTLAARAGWTDKHGVELPSSGGYGTLLRENDVEAPQQEHEQEHEQHERASEARQAHLMIVGKGIASHWASLWIFEDGDVWSVELSAEDHGQRVAQNSCVMQPADKAVQNYFDNHSGSSSDSSSRSRSLLGGFFKNLCLHICPPHPKKDCTEQVQNAVHQIWPLESGLVPENLLDDVFSAEKPPERMEEILNNASPSNLRAIAEMLLLAHVEFVQSQHWSRETRRAKIAAAADCLWFGPMPAEEGIRKLNANFSNDENIENIEDHIRERMSSFWPLLLLAPTWLHEILKNLLQEVKPCNPLTYMARVRQTMRFLWQLFPDAGPELGLKLHAFFGGIGWFGLWVAEPVNWNYMTKLPAEIVIDLTEKLLSLTFDVPEVAEAMDVKMQDAREKFFIMKEEFLDSIHAAGSPQNRAVAIQKAWKSTWCTVPDSVIAQQRQSVLRLFEGLVGSIQHLAKSDIQRMHSCQSCKRRMQDSVNILWPISPGLSTRKIVVEGVLQKYLEAFQYDVLKWPTPVGNVSLDKLRNKGERSDTIGRSYDLLFNNCQLFILNLLATLAKPDDEEPKPDDEEPKTHDDKPKLHNDEPEPLDNFELEDPYLPWNIGALAAGPMLLIMEVLFLLMFSRLAWLDWVQSERHDIFLAKILGFVWVSLQICLCFLNILGDVASRLPSWTFFGIVLGAVGTLGTLFNSATMIPGYSLFWALILVYLSGNFNFVCRDGLLVKLNIGVTLLSGLLIFFAQLTGGWSPHKGIGGCVAGVAKKLITVEPWVLRQLAEHCITEISQRGMTIFTAGDDDEQLSHGVYDAYTKRTSFLFMAKGGGSANKTYYDDLPTSGSDSGRAFRDLEPWVAWERGRILAKITADGVFVEELEHNPAPWWQYPIKTRVSLTGAVDERGFCTCQLTISVVSRPGTAGGPLIVARDIAHAKISEIFEQTGKLPQYVKARPARLAYLGMR
eukprot:Skav227717  [mRNA]  locus=scaffold802:31677:42565:- [translate_table: standard]